MSEYLHPAPTEIASFLDGRLSAAQNRSVLIHLLSGCTLCRSTARFSWFGPAPSDSHAVTNSGTLRPILEARPSSIATERRIAPTLLSQLESQPAARRLLLVSNSRRFQTPALVELLLGRSLDRAFTEPKGALEFAELAATVARSLDASIYSFALISDLRARAEAHVGNALRVLSQHSAAQQRFRIARELLLTGTGDPMEEARICSLEASLKIDQRSFDDASSLISRAATIYSRLGDNHNLGRTLIKKGSVLGESGDLRGAVANLQHGLQLLDASRDPRSLLAAKHNLVLYLHELGDSPELAFGLLQELKPLYRQQNDTLNLVRLRWLEGKLAAVLGQPTEAESAFTEVRDHFIAAQLPLDMAFVSLDLALLYLQQARTSPIRALVAQMLTIFNALAIHREAAAALLLLRTALDSETLTATLIRDVVNRLTLLEGRIGRPPS